MAYSVSGCTRDNCVTPNVSGYEFRFVTGNAKIIGFNITGVTCVPGFSGTAVATRCSSHETPYIVDGCAECPSGKYQLMNNLSTSSCKFCAAGRMFSGSSAKACQTCAIGRTQDHTNRTTNTSSCYACPAGKTWTSTATSCAACPEGRYRLIADYQIYHVNKSVLHASELGNYSSSENTSSVNATSRQTTTRVYIETCSTCNLGKEFAGRASACNICKAGKYQDENGRNSSICKDCPAGRYLIDSGGNASAHDDVGDCSTCPLGATHSNFSRSVMVKEISIR